MNETSKRVLDEDDKARLRDYYQNNKQRWVDWRKNEPPEKRLCRQAKARAKRKSIPFDLRPEDIEVPTHCPVLGVELKYNTRQNRDTSFSLDRLDPAKGYTKENVAVISQKANRMKNDATLDELKALITWMEETI